MNPATKKLDGLDALRGVAALLVLVHHAFGSIANPRNFDTILLGNFFEKGDLGVNIFFVISGFVIMWSNPRDHRSGRDVLVYVLRRIARIFPIYWVACLTVPLQWKFGLPPAGELSVTRVISDLLLLPRPDQPMLGVAWTLVFEMMFYILFVPMLVRRWLGTGLWGILAVIIIVLAVSGVEMNNAWLAHLTSPYVLEFLAGMAVCLWLQRHPLPASLVKPCIWTGGLLTAGFAVIECLMGNFRIPAHLHYAGSATLLVMGLVSLPDQPEGRQSTVYSILRLLGRHSYSVYLFHVFVQKVVIKSAIKVVGTQPGLPVICGVLVLAIVVSLGIGILIGHFVEMPILEWCKKWIAKFKLRRQPPAGPPAAALV